MSYSDIWYKSHDGLQLYARDYADKTSADKSADVIVCLPGLTRNSADFDGLSEQLGNGSRKIALDFRGRGRSAYDPNPEHYTPAVYVQDVLTLLDQLALEQVVLVGTSLGGLVAMVAATLFPQRLRAVILNDIGPELDPVGVARIQSYVGDIKPIHNWDEAISRTREINEIAFPDLGNVEWREMAHNMYRETAEGELELTYDPAIAQAPVPTDSAESPNLWPFFDSLSPIPTLLIRGAQSDILSSDCAAEMQQRKPNMIFVEVSQRGHAPLLTEPECLSAIEQFLISL